MTEPTPTLSDLSATFAEAPPPHTVWVNGAPHAVAAGTTLAALLHRLGHAPQAVATAVDGAFVARDARDGCLLGPGARVACFQPIVGG